LAGGGGWGLPVVFLGGNGGRGEEELGGKDLLAVEEKENTIEGTNGSSGPDVGGGRNENHHLQSHIPSKPCIKNKESLKGKDHKQNRILTNQGLTTYTKRKTGPKREGVDWKKARKGEA